MKAFIDRRLNTMQMNKSLTILIILVIILFGCRLSNKKGNGIPDINDIPIIIEDNNILDSIQSKTDSIKPKKLLKENTYNGEQAIIKFINDSLVNDTISFKNEYQVQIKIPGILPSLVTVAVTNGRITKTSNKNEFKINPETVGLMYFSIGYKDSLDTSTSNHVSEERIFLK